MKPLTEEELDAIDPTCVDSVTADRLIHSLRTARKHVIREMEASYSHLHMLISVWLAAAQDDRAEAVAWVVNSVDQWVDVPDLARDPWAHDWRKFWQSRDMIANKPMETCMVCGEPSTFRSQDYRACSERHWQALSGTLVEEQCRLCNEVTICAYELGRSPVCADCWPGEKLLADRRAAWRKQLGIDL